MMDVVLSFGSELENYYVSIEKYNYNWMEEFEDLFTRDDDVCLFMEYVFEMMDDGMKHYIGVIDERAFKWLVDNEFLEKIDDEYNNHYRLYLW